MQVEIKSKELQKVKTDTLLHHPKNMNIHSDTQIDRLCKIIEYQGFRNPLVVQAGTNYVVSGNGRLMAAKKLGLAELPITYQEFDSEAMLYAYMVSDNAIAKDSWAKIDEAMILENKDLLDGLDLDLLGIDDFELPDIKELDEANEDTIPENVETRCKPGDLWILGEHRLLCGDSTNIQHVEKLMAGEKADMVFTDPPYGMFLDADYSKMTSDKSFHSGKKHQNVIGDHDDFKEEFISIPLSLGCKEVFLWGADYYTECLPNRNAGSWVVWDKRLDDSADKMYGSSFELCWSMNRHKRDIARIKWAGIFGMSSQDVKTRIHPTQKPIELTEYFFDKWGKDTNSVIDLFGGSGSTLIACEKTNRKCYMSELDPHYCDVIIKRWEDYTNQKARLESSQQTTENEL